MTDKAISPLRQRMIEDMTIRELTPKTSMTTYKGSRTSLPSLAARPTRRASKTYAAISFIWRRAVPAFRPSTKSVSTPRFFFKITLGRADIVNQTQFVHVPRKLPVVLSPEEVARFLDAAPGLKYKAALSVAYGAGLRVSEVVALKVPAEQIHGEDAGA